MEKNTIAFVSWAFDYLKDFLKPRRESKDLNNDIKCK